MRKKRFIDLSLTSESREPTGSYYGRTLTEVLGDPRPCKALVRSLECTRLTPKIVSRSTSAQSNHVSGMNQGNLSNRTTSARSRATSASAISARSRATSASATCARSRATSARSSNPLGRGQDSSSKASCGANRNASAISASGISVSWKKSQLKTKYKTPATSSIWTSWNLCPVEFTVWRIENSQVHELGRNDHGFFHQGNCYIVFQTEANDSTFVHLWFGSQARKSDCEVARTYVEELDKSLNGATFMSLECEGHETCTFLRHFQDGIIIIEGRSKQQLSKASKYIKRLYIVTGRKYSTATCVECSLSAAKEKSVLILDGYPRIYIWVGKKADFVLRVKAINLARKMRACQRNGQGHIMVIDAKDEKLSNAFFRKLDSGKKFSKFNEDEALQDRGLNDHIHLYRLRGDRVMYDMPLVAKRPLKQQYLISKDYFLLDMGPSQALYVWVGNGADHDELFSALHCLQNFAQHHNYPTTLPLCRVTEGSEPKGLKTVFADWRDRNVKEKQLVRRYNVASIGRALFSKADCSLVAKLAEVGSDDLFFNGNDATELWQVNGETLEPVSQEERGVFLNWLCYLILYKEKFIESEQQVIYYWIGSKASKEDELTAERFAFSMDSVLQHKTAVVRVLDGKEPRHFFSVLHNSIIVYEADLRHDVSIQDNTEYIISRNLMFSIREVYTECMKTIQVPPLSTSLNSSAAYVIITKHTVYLWYGKNASAYEREYSKHILGYFCCNRAHQYQIITEGRECAVLWSEVKHIGEYPREFPMLKLGRHHPVLVLCSQKLGKWVFTNIPDFSQESVLFSNSLIITAEKNQLYIFRKDLCETDSLLLDTNDQLQLWCGAAVADRDVVFSKAVQAYITTDAAGRDDKDLKICLINQHSEPPFFTQYFKVWDKLGFGGELAYETARKRLRQENASNDIEQQNHMSDGEFSHIFKITQVQFYSLPEWKQHQILRSA